MSEALAKAIKEEMGRKLNELVSNMDSGKRYFIKNQFCSASGCKNRKSSKIALRKHLRKKYWQRSKSKLDDDYQT